MKGLQVCQLMLGKRIPKTSYLTDGPSECDEFWVQFRLADLPVTGHFINRDAEMTEMEECLLPQQGRKKRKVQALHGLGGIGKTQLAVAFARKHQETFSAILWINGNSKDTLTQSLTEFARRADIAHPIRPSTSTGQRAQEEEEEVEVETVLRWLSRRENDRWLAIFDNVDREYPSRIGDHQAYDIMSFLPPVDHGSILITTRLASLGEVGVSRKVERLSQGQALELLSYRSGLAKSTQGMVDPFCILSGGRSPAEQFSRHGPACRSLGLPAPCPRAGGQIPPRDGDDVYEVPDVV